MSPLSPDPKRPHSSGSTPARGAVYLSARGVDVAVDQQLIRKCPDTLLASLIEAQLQDASGVQANVCLDMPPRRLRNLVGYLILHRPPATLKDGDLLQLSRDAAMLGVSDYIHIAADVADARRQAQSWQPGNGDEPTGAQMQAQYTLSDQLSQTGHGQESTALFLSTSTAEDHFLKTVGLHHYAAIVHQAPAHARALSRMAHISSLRCDNPQPNVLGPARHAQALALAPHSRECMLVLAQILLRSETHVPIFSGQALQQGTHVVRGLCLTHAHRLPATRTAQRFAAALVTRKCMRRAVLDVSDSPFEELDALAGWLQHEVHCDIQRHRPRPRRTTPELGQLPIRLRIGLNAWAGVSIRGPLRLAHVRHRPQLACCAWLQHMAFAQEGLDLLRQHLNVVDDDAIAWSLLAQHCLAQQLYRDSLLSLVCSDAPCAPMLATVVEDMPQADATIVFGTSGTSLYHEGVMALLQALTRAEHASEGMRRQVRTTLLSYADLAYDLGAMPCPQACLSDAMPHLHAQIEAAFLRWTAYDGGLTRL